MKRHPHILLAVSLAFAGLANAQTADVKPADKIAELFGDPVIAKGAGLEIKRSELDAAVMGVKASGAARGQQLSPDQALLLERQVLERLMQIQLLGKKANEADKAQGKAEAAKRYGIILESAGSEENLALKLKSVGMNADELRSKMTEEATAEAVVVRELKAEVTDEEAKKYYDEFPARFEQPERVRASHILLSTMERDRTPLPEDKKTAKRKLAEDLLKRARAGEDFAALAREYSDDPGSKERGGEYTFPRGQMVGAFEEAAFKLATNEISDIVTTEFGYHIIKLSEKFPAQKIELAKVNDEVKELLKRQKLEKVLPDYIEKLQKDAKVEVLDEKLKQAGEMLETARAEAAARQKAAEAAEEKK